MKKKKEYEVIYEPSGRAREYSQLALNLANGCVHQCQYCYVAAFTNQKMEDFHSKSTHRVNILQKLERDLIKMKAKGDTRLVMLSFTTDPYQPIEGFNEMTREALKLFKKYDKSFHLLTKSGHLAANDFELYQPGDWFASSLTFFHASNSQRIEPNTATPNQRLEALRKAHDMGIKTWVSFEPVLIAEDTLNLYNASKDFVDFYKVGKITGYDEFPVDWDSFTNTIADLMEKDEQPFFIKHDLRPHLKKPLSEYKYHKEMK